LAVVGVFGVLNTSIGANYQQALLFLALGLLLSAACYAFLVAGICLGALWHGLGGRSGLLTAEEAGKVFA
jgi:hypothetical protein